jgi:glutathione S-transferase
MYTLIGSLKTRAVRVAWMLEELGLDYQTEPAPPQSDAVRAHSEPGKIPVLLDGDTVLTDSVAIMTYLADKHQGLTFPAGSLERAVQDGHTQFLVEEWDGILWTASRHAFVLPEDKRVPAVRESLAWEFERSCARLEARLGAGPYLMGEVLTLPDLLAAHCHRWSVNIGFPQPAAPVVAYLEGLRARDAFKRAVARQPG